MVQINPGLKPCPFCGTHPYVREGINGYAHCRTPGCWSNRCQTVSLDDAQQVAAWNRRAPSTNPQDER